LHVRLAALMSHITALSLEPDKRDSAMQRNEANRTGLGASGYVGLSMWSECLLLLQVRRNRTIRYQPKQGQLWRKAVHRKYCLGYVDKFAPFPRQLIVFPQ